jgi:D-lactate dehydrogenase (cytochrome)
MDVERGRVVSEGGFLTIPGRLFEPQRNADLRIRIPARTAPRWRDVKNAAGLHWSRPLDLVDLFVGSEGILGVTLEVRTNVLPARDPFFGLMVTLPSRALTLTLVHFLDNLRRMRAGQSPTARTQVASVLGRLDPDGDTLPIEAVSRLVASCMEWLGASTAKFVTTARRARALAGSYGCLYIEQEYAPREDPLDYASTWAGLIDRLDRMADGSPAGITSEIALDERRIRAFREEREAVPEHLNRSIRPGLVKVGTDYAVPMDHLETLLELYERRLADVDHCVFGHIGNAHLHVNMLPKTAGELEEFRGLARTLAREICAMGGTVSAEHGIGKLKQELLEIMVGREGVQAIRAAKEQFDPQGILCPGNMVH